MKNLIPKTVLVCAFGFSLTGCFSIEEEITFETTGKYAKKSVLDVSELVKMNEANEKFLKESADNIQDSEKETYEILKQSTEDAKITCEKIKSEMKEKQDLCEVTSFTCKELTKGKFLIKEEGSVIAENFAYDNGVFKIKLSPKTNIGTDVEKQTAEMKDFSAEMFDALGMKVDQTFCFPDKILSTNVGKIKENCVYLNLRDVTFLEDFLIVKVDMKNHYSKATNRIVPNDQATNKTKLSENIQALRERSKMKSERPCTYCQSNAYNKSQAFRSRIKNRRTRIQQKQSVVQGNSAADNSVNVYKKSKKRTSLENKYRYLFME